MLRDDPESLTLELGTNVTLECTEEGKPLRRTATSDFRQCVYNPLPGKPDYWLSGARPECPRIDCGVPPAIPGAEYGDLVGTKYRDSFFFGCKDEAFNLVGDNGADANLVRCVMKRVTT